MAKKESVTLPRGTLKWPKLNEVDTYQPMKNGKPNGKPKIRFITGIVFSDEDHRKVDTYLKKQLKKNDLPEDARLPWKKDKKTGEIYLEASSGKDYPPMLTDAKGREVPRSKVKVGGGTTAKVDVAINAYDGFGGGINLYINYVQIIDLKVPQRFQVEEEEGFTYEDDGTEEEEAKAPEAQHDDMDDDIPF